MFTKNKIAVVSVINDLATDNRVQKTCRVLLDSGFKVKLIGRLLKDSPPLPAFPYEAIRMSLVFTKGPAFYFFFNLRLFFKLLFTKQHLLFANDLDTLLPNFLVSKIKSIPLVYDSHELFCEVPELLGSPFKRKIWLAIEKWIVPRLKYCITVNESIAQIFEKKYHVKFTVVRNISDVTEAVKLSREDLKITADKKMLILQGAGINIDRGAEELVEAMALLEGFVLFIIGGGDVWPVLEEKINTLQLQSKIYLIRKVPRNTLLAYTKLADLGISIDKNSNPNYYNSLPNKLFDYLHSGVPVLASRLPEIEKIITKYDVGDFIEKHDPEHIADKIQKMFSGDRIQILRANTSKVLTEMNWNNERKNYEQFIQSIYQ